MVRSQFDVLGRWLEVESVTEYDESHNMTYKLMNYKSEYLTYDNGEQWFTWHLTYRRGTQGLQVIRS